MPVLFLIQSKVHKLKFFCRALQTLRSKGILHFTHSDSKVESCSCNLSFFSRKKHIFCVVESWKNLWVSRGLIHKFENFPLFLLNLWKKSKKMCNEFHPQYFVASMVTKKLFHILKTVRFCCSADDQCWEFFQTISIATVRQFVFLYFFPPQWYGSTNTMSWWEQFCWTSFYKKVQFHHNCRCFPVCISLLKQPSHLFIIL